MKRALYKTMRFPMVILLIGAGLSLIFFAESSVAGIREGLALCGQTVIPSLFPFLCFSAFIMRVDLKLKLPPVFGRLFEHIFNLPASCGKVLLMSYIGGFPVGPSMTAALYEQGRLTKRQAQRLMLFCCNAGPAFVITAVGLGICGSKQLGYLLYIGTTIASLTIGIVAGILDGEKVLPGQSTSRSSLAGGTPADALVGGVQAAVRSILGICAWVLLFSCILQLIAGFQLPMSAHRIVAGLLEVTAGVGANAGNPVFIAFILGWSGLCVQCQILGYANKAGTNVGKLLGARLLNGMLCSGIVYVLVQLFPEVLPVFASSSNAVFKASVVSVPVTVALLIMSAVFLLDLDKKQKN